MGKHRRISAAPLRPSATTAHAAARTLRAHRAAPPIADRCEQRAQRLLTHWPSGGWGSHPYSDSGQRGPRLKPLSGPSGLQGVAAFRWAAAPISSSRIVIGQAVHNSSRSVDIPDNFKSRAGVYHHSNSSYIHALCGCRRAEWGRTDVVGAHEGSTGGAADQPKKQTRFSQTRFSSTHPSRVPVLCHGLWHFPIGQRSCKTALHNWGVKPDFKPGLGYERCRSRRISVHRPRRPHDPLIPGPICDDFDE
jgi:hypothetical protein